MTRKRSQTRAPSSGADRTFKWALTGLFAIALAVTFWPRSRTASPSEAGRVAAAPNKVNSPPPAPAVPALPGSADPVKTNSVGADIAARADAMLMEQTLASADAAKINQMGTFLLTHGDPTNAVRAFRRTVELNKESEINQFNLGLALARLGQTNEAIACFQAALDIYPDYADAHNSLGLQLAALGDLDGARKHYEAALTIQPDFPQALNNLGTIFARQHRYPKAIEYFEKAVNADTNYVSAQFNLASAILYSGRTNEALGRLQDIVNQHPDYQPAQIVLTRLMSGERKP